MKLNVSEKIAIGAASCVAVVLYIIAGSSAKGGGGPGFGPQNNPGMEASLARQLQMGLELSPPRVAPDLVREIILG